MSLFNNMERNELDHKRYSEPNYSYLDRSARPELGKIRHLLEDWFIRYPDSEKERLKSRFVSKSDANHESAFFELFLHEMLLKLGCSIEIEKDKPGTEKKPDFLVKLGDQKFYIEAINVRHLSEKDSRTKTRIGALNDALNRIHSPNFFINYSDIIKDPGSPPKLKKISQQLENWLATLNPDDPLYRSPEFINSGGFGLFKHYSYRDDGWEINFFATPKKKEARGVDIGGNLGIFVEGTEWPQPIDRFSPLKKRIKKKATKYGDMEVPYMIAANMDVWVEHRHIMQSLFGQDIVTYQKNLETKEVGNFKPSRKLNGAFIGGNGPINTRVSGVLVAFGLSDWSLTKTGLCLYHNPWAQNPYNSALCCLPQATPGSEDENGHRIQFIEGKSIAEMFNLPYEWPED